MTEDYLYIHKSALPDYFEKVIAAKRLISNGEAKDVSSAVKMTGISRSTYYKYKDVVLEPSELSSSRTAVISVMLPHETGQLSALLSKISDAGCSVITINQSIPVHGRAEVSISLDVSNIDCSIDELVSALNARLIAIE